MSQLNQIDPIMNIIIFPNAERDNQTPPDHNLLQDRNVYSRSVHKFDPNGYLSSHRYNVEDSQTSATCCFTGDGHNKLAMHIITKVEKTWNKEWINGMPTE